MKRSAALAPLSRDHQHALDAALRLRRAERGTVGEALDRFQEFFEREGRSHFAIEEQLILPALPADDAEWSGGVKRVLDDHAAIRAEATALAPPPPDDEAVVQAARALGERLNAHVRYEERILFPILERRLSATRLQGLGDAVAAAHAPAREAPPGRAPRDQDEG
jgi:iron-sulfur cluster repair protein YtfE (RIC family)